jgi:hypothetical protein
MTSFFDGMLNDPDGRTVLITLGLFLFVFVPLVFLIKNWRQEHQPQAAEVMAKDPRKPVLFLRPFKEDKATFRVGSGQKVDDARAEPLILEPFKIFGPLVAIGSPEESMPPWAGAARYYVAGDDWHSSVRSLLDQAQLVVIFAGVTEGLKWELGEVFRHEPFVPTVVLGPFFGEQTKSFQTGFQAATGIALPENINGSRLIYFPKRDEPTLFADTKDEDERMLTIDNPYLGALTRVIDVIQPGSGAPWIKKAYDNQMAKYIGIAIAVVIWIFILMAKFLSH